MIGLRLLAVLVVAVVGSARTAASEPATPAADARSPVSAGPPVQLLVDECLRAHQAEIRRLFALELRAQPIEEATVEEPSATRARVTCTPDGEVELRVDDPLTGKRLARAIGVTSTPDDQRPRLVALALVELVYAAWSELVLTLLPSNKAARADDGGAREAAAQVVREKLEKPATPVDLRLAAVGSLRRFGGGSTPLFGGGLRFGAEHGSWLGWHLDVLLEHGQRGTSSGTITCTAFSSAAWLTARLPWSFVDPYAGIGVRGGVGWLRGKPADPTVMEGRSVTGAFVGPAGVAGVTVRLPARLLLDLRVETGWVARPVTGAIDGEDVEGLRGAWVAGLLGVGWRP